MGVSNAPQAVEQVEPKERRKLTYENGESELTCEAAHEPEWFDTVAARNLLNSMTRKVRLGPPAKPLKRA